MLSIQKAPEVVRLEMLLEGGSTCSRCGRLSKPLDVPPDIIFK